MTPLTGSELRILREVYKRPTTLLALSTVLVSPANSAYRLIEKTFITWRRDHTKQGRPTTYTITEKGRLCVEAFEGVV